MRKQSSLHPAYGKIGEMILKKTGDYELALMTSYMAKKIGEIYSKLADVSDVAQLVEIAADILDLGAEMTCVLNGYKDGHIHADDSDLVIRCV